MSRPDVILIHCHDLGKWLPSYGMPSVPAPNLTTFAGQSVVFDRAFSTAPLCSPARGSLHTGLSPHRNGVLGLAHHNWRYREGVTTLPERLRPLGYRSTLIGLQHENADPSVLGYDEVGGIGFLPRAWQVAEATEAWLGRQVPRAERDPFMLTVGIWEVHRPWPAEDYEHADPADVEVPPYLPDTPHTREDVAGFYGSIRQLDAAVGQLLRRIDELCDPENTMVVFTTDHGAAFPRAKGTLYDPGTGVAFMVRPPSSWNTAPGRREELVSHLDVVPTLLELAGAEPDPELEGESLVPLLRDGEPGRADRLVFTQKNFHDGYDPIRAVRGPRYKYIRNFADGPMLTLSLDLVQAGYGDDAHLAPRPAQELYDLQADPWEQCNLADDPQHADVREELARELDDWMRRTRDPLLDGDLAPAPARTRDVDALPALA